MSSTAGAGGGWRCAWPAPAWPRPAPTSSGGRSREARAPPSGARRWRGSCCCRRPRTPTSSTPASGPSTTGCRTSPSRRRTCCRRSPWPSSPARGARARAGSPCSPCRGPGSWAASLGLAFPTISSATALTTVSFLALGGPRGRGRAPAAGVGDGPRASSSASSTATSTGPPCRRRSWAPWASSASCRRSSSSVALAAALVVALRAPWGRIAVRVAGSWIVAIGLLLLGWSFRVQ